MRCLWIFLLCCWCSASLWAKPVRDGHVEVELVAGPPGQVGVLFRMDPEWHVYWQNPGETGFAPRFKWTLPPGWKAGEPIWPVPFRLVLAGIQQFVYEKEVLIRVPLQAPPGAEGQPAQIKVEVEWLACAETCIPGKAKLELKLPAAEVAGAFQSQDDLPQSPGNIQLRAWRLGADKAMLEYPGQTGDRVDFFPLREEDNPPTPPVWKPGEGLELSLVPQQKSLRGLLVINREGQHQGISIEVPIADAKPASVAAPLASPTVPEGTLLGSLLAAFIGGMILNLMPCVFPVLSLKALSLLHHNEEGKSSAWAQGWVYTAGVLVSVWAIAAPIVLFKSGTGQLGWGYQMQSPLFVAGLTALFLLIALNLFGLFEVGEGLTQLASVAQGKKGLSESFWSGAVATAAATPCTAPFMASALGFAVSQPAPVALLIFTMLGLGMAFPYLVLCGFPATRTWLPRPGAWMESFKQLMGFPMLGAVVWFLYILANLLSAEGLGLVMAAMVLLSMASWMYGRWGYSPSGIVRMRAKLGAALLASLSLAGAVQVARDPAYQPTSGGGGVVESGGLTWEPYSKPRLEELRQQGKPVFIDFTASWCVNCKVNELGALRNSAVVEAFRSKGIVMMKADWTRKDEAITRALAEFGRTGVPFYVLYPRSGEPIPLPEILTPGNILAALDRY